jgi:hypothetical protein
MPNQRIEITDFTPGLAPSRFYGAPGMADPVNTAGWFSYAAREENILQRGFGTASLTDASFIDGEMLAMVQTNRGSSSRVYGIATDSAGTGAKLHNVNPLTDAVLKASPWPRALPADTPVGGFGAELYDGYFYYSFGRYLGRYDMSLTFNDSFNSSLTHVCYGNTVQHPMVQGNGKLFIGNAQAGGGASVATVAGEVVTLVALDLKKTDKVVKAIEFSGNKVYIAMSGNLDGSALNAENSLIVWDTVSASWQEEYRFPDLDFTALRSMNGRLYCFGRNGLYEFSGGRFVQVFSYTWTVYPYGVQRAPNGVLHWSDAAGGIWSYGAVSKDFKDAVHRPGTGFGFGAGRSILFPSASKCYVSKDTGDGLRNAVLSGAASYYGNGEWRTPVFNLGKRVKVCKIYVFMLPLAAGSSTTFTVYDETGVNASCGTANETGQTVHEYTVNGQICETFQLGMVHSDGQSPKIRKIVIEYELVKE